MALILDENTAPADFTGQGDARGSPFFKAMARELGGSPGVKLIEAGKLVKGMYARSRLQQVFDLTQDQVGTVLVKAGVSTEVVPVWRRMLESASGFNFALPNVPASAHITTILQNGEGQGDKAIIRENTVSAQLGFECISRVSVPENLFSIVECKHPENRAISDTQVRQLSTAHAVWIFCKTGKFNIGARLVEHNAKQFDARYKFRMAGGKKNTRLDWEAILNRKALCLNRPDATVSSHHACLHVHTTASLTHNCVCRRNTK